MGIWFKDVDVETINARAKESLSDHLDIKFTEIGEDYLTATMPLNAKTKQPMGIMHGGASCALAETVASAAANYCIDQTEFVCVGLDINVNHLKSVRSGFVKAKAKPFHIGRKTQVWEIKITDEKAKLIAIARLTLAVISILDLKK